MENNNKVVYDEYMDEECIPLCDALNSLPEVKTFESCCGHCKHPFMIFVEGLDYYHSLNVIARAFDRRYSRTHLVWKVEIETHDNGTFNLYIHTDGAYKDHESMMEDVEQLVDNLNYWREKLPVLRFGPGRFVAL